MFTKKFLQWLEEKARSGVAHFRNYKAAGWVQCRVDGDTVRAPLSHLLDDDDLWEEQPAGTGPPDREICQWSETGNFWQTSCGQSVYTWMVDPYQGVFEFCPYCSEELKMVDEDKARIVKQDSETREGST